MEHSPSNPHPTISRPWRKVFLLLLIFSIICLAFLLFFQRNNNASTGTKIVPIALHSVLEANYDRDDRSSLPGVGLGVIADAIRDHEPDAMNLEDRITKVFDTLQTPVLNVGPDVPLPPGDSPTPSTLATLSPPTPTPPAPATAAKWVVHELDPLKFGGPSSVIRVWVREGVGYPITIEAANGSWETTAIVGGKDEYGPDTLEFAPLQPGLYKISSTPLGFSFTLEVESGQIGQAVIEQE